MSEDLATYGKIPPQAISVEEAVLAAILIEEKSFDIVANQFFPEVFYKDCNRVIAKAIVDLRKGRKSIDILTVSEQLRKNGDLDAAGGEFSIIQLSNKIGTAANISHHMTIVFEKWVLRELITWSTNLIKESYDDTSDVIELRERYEREWNRIQRVIVNGQIQTLETQIDEAINLISRQMEQTGGNVLSKHASINKHLGGWQKQTLNIIAARPGMGKSAFLVSEVMFQLKRDFKVLVFNLEMNPKQFFTRCLCNYSEITNKRAKIKDFRAGEQLRWHDGEWWLKSKDNTFTVDFTGGISIEELMAKAKKIKMDKGLDIIYIDYLQLVGSAAIRKNQSRDEIIGTITKQLKNFSKTEDIAIVALAALNRNAEGKADKRPTLSDLRESGNIEGDADTVSFLLRPEYYFKKNSEGEIQYDSGQEQFRNICQFFNEKNREDTTFQDEFKCLLGISKFYDIGTRDEEPEQISTGSGKQGSLIPMDEAKKKTVETEDSDLPF